MRLGSKQVAPSDTFLKPSAFCIAYTWIITRILKKACFKISFINSEFSRRSPNLTPWQNRAEPEIGEIKKFVRKIIMNTQAPIRLWCFYCEYTADLLSLLAIGRFDLQGRTLYEVVMNYTPKNTFLGGRKFSRRRIAIIILKTYDTYN